MSHYISTPPSYTHHISIVSSLYPDSIIFYPHDIPMAHAILCISSSTVSVALGNLLDHEDQEIYRIVRTHIKLVVSNPYNSIKYTTGDIPLYNCFFHPFTVHVAASAPGRSPKKTSRRPWQRRVKSCRWTRS